LRISKAKLELITDPDMYLMVEDGIRGGISTIMHRYAKANNKYMGDLYNHDEESSYIMYLDASALYSWAMSHPLPLDGFWWMSQEDLDLWVDICYEDGVGAVLDVDLEYPQELHDSQNEYPLAPERLMINRVKKLIPNLSNKKRYVVHHRNLKQYKELGHWVTKYIVGWCSTNDLVC